jgi:protein phosphatase 2C family protein 2/3
MDQKCYIANVGDSRAMIYSCKNKKITNLTHDHKPNSSIEKKRIIENGG